MINKTTTKRVEAYIDIEKYELINALINAYASAGIKISISRFIEESIDAYIEKIRSKVNGGK